MDVETLPVMEVAEASPRELMLALTNQMMALAFEISATGIAHVFVRYSGHIDGVHVYAHPVDSDYSDPASVVELLSCVLHLKMDSVEQVIAVRDRLSRLLNGVASCAQ